ncbi:poly(ADP-ribose) glycohydrolase ARH3 [Elysia marginata]|uniref:Poly(ADP-ribose) glycohydrolase ARH3 n=1 Tax=Elysia marginata TaxID=1093978 RepID=A0AAV4JR52_9GAST|nr:poly(ADP-ribose) glycohydrolase ARH3 [Elysia marginata]
MRTVQARATLLAKGLGVGGRSVTVFAQNPFVVRGPDGREIPGTKIIVSDVPISLANVVIEDALKKKGVKMRSSLKMEGIRDKEGKLTEWLSGRHFAYIDVPEILMERMLNIGQFKAKIFYKEMAEANLCFASHKSGHRAVDCPMKNKNDESSNEEPENSYFRLYFGRKSGIMSKPVISDAVKRAKAEALWGLFVADSLAMPVHWFYNPSDIKKNYGNWLTGYVAPSNRHPSSILRLSAVDGSGRGSSSSSEAVIGNVILHDKLKYWTGGNSSNHYHQGMKAGDNTLNAVMALKELQTMNRVDHNLIAPERDVRGSVLSDYVAFMTTPGSHNDTYAESFHRAFFKDWMKGDKPTEASKLLEFAEERSKTHMAGHPDHQLAVIGSLVATIPWIVRNAHRSEKDCAQSAVDFVRLTHPVPSLIQYVDTYARLLHAVINGKDLKSEVLRVFGHSIFGGPSNRDRILSILDKAESVPRGSEARLELYQELTSMLGSACYIEGAMKSMMLLALEFSDDFQAGVLANANCGGENCHRGAALGALLGAAAANQKQGGVPAKLKDGLCSLKLDIQKAVTEMNEGF